MAIQSIGFQKKKQHPDPDLDPQGEGVKEKIKTCLEYSWDEITGFGEGCRSIGSPVDRANSYDKIPHVTQ